jgi:pimeloyl-ACP methyl ester carboxylesterase
VFLAAAMGAVFLSTSCSTPGGGPAAGAPVTLDTFYAQKLTWGGCGALAVSADDKKSFVDPAYDCTYLRVPLDYSHPEAGEAKLAVLRRKATSGAQRIGSLVVDPGGPGASGTSTAVDLTAQVANTPVGQRFDLIGFDPRGVGASQPAVKCFTPAERDADRLDDEVDTSPAGVARIQAKEKDYDKKCVDRSGGDALLANVGTRDAARDIDIMRAALGDQKLTYLGYSYGTDLGTAYAEQFPRNVRALVLDGAIDPAQNQQQRALGQAAGFQHAFDTFAAWCTGQPACALGHDPAQTTEAYRRLVLPLIDHQVSLADGRKLSYGDAQTATIQALYATQLWAPLNRGLQELAAGQGRILTLLADLYYGRQPDGTYTYELDAFNAVNCVDDKPVTDPATELAMSKQAIAAAPFEDDGHGPSPALDDCAFWPVPNTGSPHTPHISGLPPVLVISVTGDPATPYQSGVNLARDLNARLLTVEGTQHTAALQGISCVDDIVTRYFTDLALPTDGTRCTATTPH